MLWSKDADGRNEYFNNAWVEFAGPAARKTGFSWLDLVHSDDREKVAACWAHAFRTGEPYEAEYRLQSACGDYRWVMSRARCQRGPAGKSKRWYGTLFDIHDRKRAELALQRSEVMHRSLLEASGDCIKVLDLGGELQLMNTPGLCAMEIESFASVRGRRWPSLWPQQAQEAAENALATARAGEVARFTGLCPTAKGMPKWWDVMVTPIKDDGGRVAQILCISRDITSARDAAERLRYASEHDPLTNLPNRRSFEAKLQSSVIRAVTDDTNVGLLLLDLDHFKHVNDTFGHAAGDYVLETFSNRLRSSLRSGDFVARLGGDEFAVILENLDGEQALVDASTSILERLLSPMAFEGRMISGGASIGGALFPLHAECADQLLKHADVAMYALKAEGRGGTKIFHQDMRGEAQRIASQINLARSALAGGSIIPFYQPKVDLISGRIVGLEALLRWQHSSGKMQLPDTIAEAFKEYELASRIGQRMQSAVIRDIANWERQNIEIGRISINAAPVEFLRNDYAERLLALLYRHRVSPTLLEVEVTEQVFFERGAQYVRRALEVLSLAGVRISLDDFGTGFSSLAHLRDFPVDVVKIDKSFIADMVREEESASIVAAVVGLAHNLKIEVVAEGIERADQVARLLEMSCSMGQGFLFGQAMRADAVAEAIGGSKAAGLMSAGSLRAA